MNKLRGAPFERIELRSDRSTHCFFLLFLCLPVSEVKIFFFSYSNLKLRRPESCEHLWMKNFAKFSINRQTLAPDNNVLNNKKCVHLIRVTFECVSDAFNIKWNCWRGHCLTLACSFFRWERDSLVHLYGCESFWALFSDAMTYLTKFVCEHLQVTNSQILFNVEKKKKKK